LEEKTVIRWFKTWLLAGSLSFLAACGGSDDGTRRVVDRITTDPQFSTLATALETAGLSSTFGGSDTYTVFAPTNAAFAALLAELGITQQQLLADRALLTTVLTYHVLPGDVRRAAIPAGRAITTLQGGVFKIEAAGSGLVLTDGRNRRTNITTIDLVADNGVVHVVDRVLLPANANLVATAQSVPAFSTLVSAVVAAGLVDTLSGPGPFTVFAPTNDAFAALLAELGVTAEELLADTALLTRVLTYHVVPGRVLAADIAFGAPITTVQGGTFSVGNTLAITDARGRSARIVGTDVFATNGVVHTVDRVILPLPEENIVELAQANPQFSILVEAVVAADLVGTLSAAGPFTVFAPTNDAFVALLGELGVSKEALLADVPLLTRVLTTHVLGSRVLAAQIVPDAPITTVQGGRISIGADLAITDPRNRRAGIVGTDVIASNGVIHAIDRVLLPLPAESVVATAQSLPQFSILVEAVVAAGLVDTLSSAGPFTVFAPTNDAFAALLGELGVSKEALLANTELLTAVLTYHVLPARVLAAQITSDAPITTVQGASFSIGADLAITDGRARRANIVGTDVFTSNGVIHVIDRVILPPVAAAE
jgi:uncharacterized surface protein with fasciclin (FAS1) repeats